MGTRNKILRQISREVAKLEESCRKDKLSVKMISKVRELSNALQWQATCMEQDFRNELVREE